MIYGHGDDLYNFGGSITANFSSNVWPGGPDARVVEAMQRSIAQTRNYPEPNADTIRHKLADRHHLSHEIFLVTNGAAEAFYLIAQTFRQTTATIFIPTFSEYEDAAIANDITCSYQSYTDICIDTKINTRLAFICNPNNPTGQQLSSSLLLQLINNHPKTLFIVDEAYSDFTRTPESLLRYIDTLPNLIIVHSFTKTFAIPGLRTGFIAGHPDVIQKITRYKAPWSLNTIALHTTAFILDHYDSLLPDVGPLLEECNWLKEAIAAIDGFDIIPSNTTYFLVKMHDGIASALKQHLANEVGCLIRDASNFRGLDHRYFRIATQNREENMTLLKGLRAWKASSIATSFH
jgi:threonine-phosphate decarboxylase